MAGGAGYCCSAALIINAAARLAFAVFILPRSASIMRWDMRRALASSRWIAVLMRSFSSARAGLGCAVSCSASASPTAPVTSLWQAWPARPSRACQPTAASCNWSSNWCMGCCPGTRKSASVSAILAARGLRRRNSVAIGPSSGKVFSHAEKAAPSHSRMAAWAAVGLPGSPTVSIWARIDCRGASARSSQLER